MDHAATFIKNKCFSNHLIPNVLILCYSQFAQQKAIS